jgi:hypothetical protein
MIVLNVVIIGSLAPLLKSSSAGAFSDRMSIFRVSVRSPVDVDRLTSGGYDVLEGRGENYLLILGDDAVAETLRSEGFTVTIDQELSSSSGIETAAYFGGYRTVAEHYAHLDRLVATHPNLAVTVDYGDSWRKQNDRPDGHDLRAICITKLRPGDCALTPTTDKPRFFLMAAIHARELSASEVAWRWLDFLVEGYGNDPDVTALLDYSEMWVVPVANPDGRLLVEQGGERPTLQRKNANDALGDCANPPTGSSQFGVDLNRNASFKWGLTGASDDPCSLVYRGAAPASEPETAALEALLSSLFPDQRGPNDSDAAALTTNGAMISLHSFSDLIILPWGTSVCGGFACPPEQRAPNDAGLRSFAFRMGAYNGYQVGQASEILYPVNGATDDWLYGTLGIPAFTFEVGPATAPCGGFLPDYACQETFWSLNRDALLYAARTARQPYTSALGPTVRAAPGALQAPAGSPVTFTAIVNDGAYGESGVDRPAAQAIAAAELYIDAPPWAGGSPLTMSAQDGAFDSFTESATVQLNTQLSIGRHMLFVRGRDAEGNWGPITAQWLDITDPNLPPPSRTLSQTVHLPLVVTR